MKSMRKIFKKNMLNHVNIDSALILVLKGENQAINVTTMLECLLTK